MDTSAAAASLVESFNPIPSSDPVFSPDLRSFSCWKDFVLENFPWLEHQNHTGNTFSARIQVYRFSGAFLSTISAGACEVVRSRPIDESSEQGFIKIIWQMSGRLHVDQDGRSDIVESNRAVILDTARPYRIQLSQQSDFAVLVMPYEVFPNWDRIGPLVCGTKTMDGPLGRAAFGALIALASLPPAAIRTQGDAVLRAVQWMLYEALLRGVQDRALPADARMSKARRHIIKNFSDPNLCPDSLASALCMSRRALYLLFSKHRTTPAKLINDIRLERARQVLGNPGLKHRKATDVAFDSGYTDYATFSRMFKSRFGFNPSQCRFKTDFAIHA